MCSMGSEGAHGHKAESTTHGMGPVIPFPCALGGGHTMAYPVCGVDTAMAW